MKKRETQLKRIMEEQGVKPYDLVKGIGLKSVPLGIHRAYNGQIRAGNLPYNTLKYLSDYLGVSIDEIVEPYESNGQEYKTNQGVSVINRSIKRMDLLEDNDRGTIIYTKSLDMKGEPVFFFVEEKGLHRTMNIVTYSNGRILMHKMDLVDEEFNPRINFEIVELTPLFYQKIEELKTSSLEREKLLENKNNISEGNGGTNSGSGNTLDSLEGNFQNSEKNKSGEEIKEEIKTNPVFSPLPIDFNEEQRKYFIRSDMFIPEFMLDLDAIYQDADLSQYAKNSMESVEFFNSLYNQLLALGVK